MYETMVDENEITIKVSGKTVADFEDNGNGMEGEIFEGDYPYRMSAHQMLEIAEWLIRKAKERILHSE